MVDPACKDGAAALGLLEKFLSGPQDISIADEANDTARMVWQGLGGQTAYLYSMRWTRPLRPFAYFMSLLKKAHLGEVSVTVWPKVLKDMCKKKNIHVLE